MSEEKNMREDGRREEDRERRREGGTAVKLWTQGMHEAKGS